MGNGHATAQSFSALNQIGAVCPVGLFLHHQAVGGKGPPNW